MLVFIYKAGGLHRRGARGHSALRQCGNSLAVCIYDGSVFFAQFRRFGADRAFFRAGYKALVSSPRGECRGHFHGAYRRLPRRRQNDGAAAFRRTHHTKPGDAHVPVLRQRRSRVCDFRRRVFDFAQRARGCDFICFHDTCHFDYGRFNRRFGRPKSDI